MKRLLRLQWGAVIVAAFAAGYFARRGHSVNQTEPVRAQPIVKHLPTPRTDSLSVVDRAPASPTDVAAPRVSRTWVPQARAVQFHPRAEGEWQGMLVDVAVRPPCESTQSCQVSLACVAGTCGPCGSDAGCAAGEGCVLDHCLLRSHTDCRSARDCPAGELCMIVSDGSDALRDVRGNLFLRSLCTTNGRSPDSPQPLDEEIEVYQAPDPPPLPGPAPNLAIEHLQTSFAQTKEET